MNYTNIFTVNTTVKAFPLHCRPSTVVRDNYTPIYTYELFTNTNNDPSALTSTQRNQILMYNYKESMCSDNTLYQIYTESDQFQSEVVQHT